MQCTIEVDIVGIFSETIIYKNYIFWDKMTTTAQPQPQQYKGFDLVFHHVGGRGMYQWRLLPVVGLQVDCLEWIILVLCISKLLQTVKL